MTLLLGLAAVNTGNNLLYLLVAGLLAFMSVSGLAGWLNIRGLTVALELPREVYRNRPALLAITVANGKVMVPSFILDAKIENAATLFPLVAGGEKETRGLSVTFPKRGILPLDAVTVASRFPVNFFVRSIRIPLDISVTVFPDPRVTSLPAATGAMRQNPVSSSSRAGEGGEIRRIGDYTGTESLRRIHWRLSARHGELKVKEFEALSGEPVLIDLHDLPGLGIEERLSRASYLVNLLMGQGRCVGVRGEGFLIPPAGGHQHRLRLLRELACHDGV